MSSYECNADKFVLWSDNLILIVIATLNILYWEIYVIIFATNRRSSTQAQVVLESVFILVN